MATLVEVPSAIVVRDLTKRYSGQAVVNNVSLTIRQGEIFGLLGPNGAGKTTLLEMVEGLRQPETGTINVLGLDVRRQRRQVQARIGVQLQATTLFSELTVGETITLFGGFFPTHRRVADLLKEVNLTEKERAFSGSLSGGQRQRLALALALVNDPEVIFLDEPTTGLDPQSRHMLWESVQNLRRRGKTIVLTTHFMDEAQLLCDRIAIMDHGAIIAQDTPAELITQLGSSTTIEYATGEATGLSEHDVRALPGVTDLRAGLERNVIYSGDAEATLVALMRAAALSGVTLRQVQIHAPTLEDVFLKLTGRSLRD
ncbi:MAG: ABC transporter ATP-binding protein [Ktedonobacterales bacterium]